MNSFKRTAAKLRSNYVKTTAFSLLSHPELKEGEMEELWMMINTCTSFTIIKYLFLKRLISESKCASLLGISNSDLIFKYNKYFNQEIYESYFGV